MNAEDASPRDEAPQVGQDAVPTRYTAPIRHAVPAAPPAYALEHARQNSGSRSQPHSHRSPRNRARFVRRFGQLRNRKLPSLRHLRMRLPHVLFPPPRRRRQRLVLRKYPLHQNLPHHKPHKRLSRMYRRDGIVFHIRHIRRRTRIAHSLKCRQALNQ